MAESESLKKLQKTLEQFQEEVTVREKELKDQLTGAEKTLKDEIAAKWEALDEDLGEKWKNNLKEILRIYEEGRRKLIYQIGGALIILIVGGGLFWDLREQLKQMKEVAEGIEAKTSAMKKEFTDKSSAQDEVIEKALSTAKARFDDELRRAEDANTDSLSRTTARFQVRLNTAITDAIDEKLLVGQAATQLIDKLQRETEQRLGNNMFANAMGIMSAVKMSLDSPQREGANARYSRMDPTRIRELLYSADAMVATYGPQLATGTLDAQRRVSLLYIMHGIIDRSRGDDVSAEQWFRRAVDIDPEIPEASIFLARIRIESASYIGDGKYSAEASQREALTILEQAVSHSPANVESRLGRIDLAHLRADALANALVRGGTNAETGLIVKPEDVKTKYSDALIAADDEIRREIADYRRLGFARSADARVYYKKAYILIRRYTLMADHAEQDRRAAVDTLREAILADPEYLKAISSFVWFSTHRWDDEFLTRCAPSITLPTTLPDTYDRRQELEERIQEFGTNTLTFYNPQLLNNVSEAYMALADDLLADGETLKANDLYKSALSKAHRAVEVAKVYGANVSDLNFCEQRLEKLTQIINKLQAETKIPAN